MPETLVETTSVNTERVVTEEPASTPVPELLNPPPAGAVTPSPDPAAIVAATEAIAVGAAIGVEVGRAQATAEVAAAAAGEATAEAINWQSRAEAAESERETLRARLVELETPPAETAGAPAELVTVETEAEPKATEASSPPPKTPRGMLMRLLLG